MLWKPILGAVAVVAAREVCVYAVRLATDHAHRAWIRKKVRDKLNVIRRDFRPDDKPRDGRGRFTKPDDEGR